MATVVAPAFDWRALVARSQPGGASASQRAQAARLALAMEGLTIWAEQFGLLSDFVRSSAIFAVVCTSPDSSAEMTLALAQLILWIYSLDTTLDTQSMEHMSDPAWVDATTRASVAPLLADLTSAARRHLGWDAPPVAEEAAQPPLIGRLGPALDDWRVAMTRAWALRLPAACDQRAWRRLLAEQLTRNVAEMRQELAWSSAWRRSQGTSAPPTLHAQRTPPTLIDSPSTVAPYLAAPTLATYLAVATRTTGAHPTFALVCPSLGCLPRVWARRRPLVNAAARVIRLANDAYSLQSDLTEGNITAATCAFLRLRAADARARHTSSAPERLVVRARRQMARHLDTAITAFAHQLATQPAGDDADYLRYTVAWALAHYSERA